MGVFGPLTFLALAAGATMLIRPSVRARRVRRELWLASFIAPPLLVIVGAGGD